jgi:type IV secretion system protein VirD4
MIVLRWLWFGLKVCWWLLGKLASGLAIVVRAASPDYRAQGALGTARWASSFEKFFAGITRGVGPVIGKTALGRLIRFNRDGIVQVYASTGSGKGLGIVIPTLLDYPGSIVVTDVKGENYGISARYRAKIGRVVMLNPSDLAHSARFNPMDMIRVGTDQEGDDARALASLMILRDPKDQQHWADKSNSLLTALILHALHDRDPVNRTLAHVRKLSVGDMELLQERVRDIATHSHSPQAQSAALAFMGTMGKADSQMPEFASILSDLHKATEPWTEGTPAGRLASSSTFHLEDLNGPEPLTLYFCVDEEKLQTYRRWLRVMTGCTLNALMRAKRTRRPRHKVVLLLDEVRALGRLEPLLDGIGFLRAYCTPVLIWQNMPQARSTYGEAAADLLANTSCRVFFGVTDNETGQYVSTMCGQTGIRTRSEGVSQPADAWMRENRSQGQNEGGYWLIDTAEVQRLPSTIAIVKMAQVAYPMLVGRVSYLRRLRWTFRYDRWEPSATAPVAARSPERPPAPPGGPTPPPGAFAGVPPPAARSAPPPTDAVR